MLLLDASILIDFLNKISQAVDYFLAIDSRQAAISAVTLAEVLAGADEQEKAQILLFTDRFHFLNIDKETSVFAADLRQKYHWKLPDSFQAALALKHNLIFVTRNTKDFNPAVHKFVKIPYKLR
ncbi:MAG: PIN domain-containing protein [Candidatus Omnitrophica bacterium]|nr:PIN domain-containing protein [Candidatus Omnitrophota bacterium]MDE2214413.1 PIN domain-containing protein [Candidatus Omnitrophota bacterium]